MFLLKSTGNSADIEVNNIHNVGFSTWGRRYQGISLMKSTWWKAELKLLITFLRVFSFQKVELSTIMLLA